MIAIGAGLVCPKCGGKETAVTDSRAGANFIRRRRKCVACTEWNRFTTVEVTLTTKVDFLQPMTVRIASDVQAVIDALPSHKREIVLSLVAAFAADEVKT